MLILKTTLGAQELLKWEKLDEGQKETALKIYKLAKPSGYEMTMIAIAWKESRLGKYPINLQDPSCGAHHIQIVNYINLFKIKDTPLNRNIYCSKLIEDIAISTYTALEIFLTFKAFHKNNYSKAIRSYNAGYSLDNNKGMKYYEEVYNNVKELEKIREKIFEN